jgi:hypothetical protein
MGMKKRDISNRQKTAAIGACFGLSSQNGRKNRPFRPLDGKYWAITASGVPSFLGLLEAI